MRRNKNKLLHRQRFIQHPKFLKFIYEKDFDSEQIKICSPGCYIHIIILHTYMKNLCRHNVIIIFV